MIEPGILVAFRTDWSKRWPNNEAFENIDADDNPDLLGWGIDPLKFLFKERKISAVGHKKFNTDSSVDVAKNGSPIAEYYVLEQNTFQLELLKS